jgi:hypothetical protein
MATDNETGKFLTIAKIVQTVLILAVLVYAVMLYVVLPRLGFGVIYDDPLLITIAQVFGVISVGALAIGFLMPWLASRRAQPEKQMLFVAYIMRTTMLGSIAIFGLILGILGAEDSITMLFLIVSAGALIFTFPTKKRWQSFSGDKGRS